jgi:hypothetical protein
VQTLEETGYNIEHLVDQNAFIQAKGHTGKEHKLFIVVGLDPDTAAFAPQTNGVRGSARVYVCGELMNHDANECAGVGLGYCFAAFQTQQHVSK